jgi:AcrR family transcriptional regulator
LLKVAAELFAARGFSGVTVDDIGAAAGVTGPAIYHHFESKEAMLGEMLIGISQHLLVVGRSIRDTAAPDRQLDELVRMHVDFAVDQRAVITVHFRDLPRAAPADHHRVRRLQREYAEIWVEALTVGAPDLPADAARTAVHAVLGLINSTPFSTRLRRSESVRILCGMAGAALGAVGPLVTEYRRSDR